jgi:hypothetical protein
MIFHYPPPQFGQYCMWISNTRLSSRAQLMRDAQRRPSSSSAPTASECSRAPAS